MAGAYGRSWARPPGTRNPNARPRLLSLLLLAAVAGAFVWATLAHPAGHSGHGGTKSVVLALDRNGGHGAAPASDRRARTDTRVGSPGADAAKTLPSATAAPAILDSPPSREAIDDRLAEAVRGARVKGAAVAMAFPLPVMLRRIARWTREADKQSVALAPITALALAGGAGGEERSDRAS